MQYLQLDPEGCELRRAHRLRRRVYHNAGPNVVRHVDGYNKLKPYGFPICGCIDGWSRKILSLVVTRSNNYPDKLSVPKSVSSSTGHSPYCSTASR